MKTKAEELAEKLGDDGQQLETAEGVYILDAAKEMGAKVRHLTHRLNQIHRIEFTDGSSIILANDTAWDFALDPAPGSECTCWRGDGRGSNHEYPCPLADSTTEEVHHA